MAHKSTQAQRQSKSQVELFPPSIPGRLVCGHEISLYYNLHPVGRWDRDKREQLEIALFFRAGVCRVGWQVSSNKWTEREACGPHVCLIAPGLAHECRLEGDAELLVLYVERSLLRRV